MTDHDLISGIIRREGGWVYSNHPADRGGPTKGGITRETLSLWRGRPASALDVEQLTEQEGRAIYHSRYLEPFSSVLDEAARVELVDMAVLHGTGRAVRWMQVALGVEADGIVGPKTRAAQETADWPSVMRPIRRIRLKTIGSILSGDHRRMMLDVKDALLDRAYDRIPGILETSQTLNAAGWLNRISDFL